MFKRFIRMFVLLFVLLWCVVPSGAFGASDSFFQSSSPFLPHGTVGYTAYYITESNPIIVRLSYTDAKGTEVTQEYTDTTTTAYSSYVITSRTEQDAEIIELDNQTFIHRCMEANRQYTVYVYSADRSLSHGPIVYIHNLISEDQPALILDYADGELCVWPRYRDNQNLYFDIYRIAGKGKAELFRSDCPAGQLPVDKSVTPGETYTYYIVAKTSKSDVGIQSEMLSITIPAAVAP